MNKPSLSNKTVQIPLKSINIKGKIVGKFLEIEYIQLYENPTDKFIETQYTFPLNDKGRVCGLRIETDDNIIEAEVEEKQKAKEIYEKTKKEGDSGFMLESTRKNVFNIYCGNIPPRSTCKVILNYIENTESIDGKTRLLIPTVTGLRYVPKDLITEQNLEEISKIISPVVPEKVPYNLDFNLEIHSPFKISDIKSPSNEIKISNTQKNIYKIESSNPDLLPDRDIIIEYEIEKEPKTEVIEVNKNSEKYILIEFLPEMIENINRENIEILFMIDTSGSMLGSKIEQAKNMLSLCLRHLKNGDYFNIAEFNSYYKFLFEKPELFSGDTLNKADRWIDNLYSTGGTEIYKPLIELLQTKITLKNRIIVLLTDGEVFEDRNAITEIKKKIKKTRIFPFGIDTAVNSYFLNELAKITGGKAEFITPKERIDESVTAQFSRILFPVAENIELKHTFKNNIEIYPDRINCLFNYEPLRILIKTEPTQIGAIELVWESNGKGYKQSVELNGKYQNQYFEIVKKMFQAEKIDNLECELNKNIDSTIKETEKEIINLSKESKILCSLTNYIGVKKLLHKAESEPEYIRIPVMMPSEWEMGMHFWQSIPKYDIQFEENQIACCIRTISDIECSSNMEITFDDKKIKTPSSWKKLFSPGKEIKISYGNFYDSIIHILKKQNVKGIIEFIGDDREKNILLNKIFYIICSAYFSAHNIKAYSHLTSKLKNALISAETAADKKAENVCIFIDTLFKLKAGLTDENQTLTVIEPIITECKQNRHLNKKSLKTLEDLKSEIKNMSSNFLSVFLSVLNILASDFNLDIPDELMELVNLKY